MNDLSVLEIAEKWGVSERTVRNYCMQNRIPGAYRKGRAWRIPEDAVFPERMNGRRVEEDLLSRLRKEKNGRTKGGIYHKIQIDLTYYSNHMEGSKLTHDETRYIYETNTVGIENKTINVDDIVETVNHFRCIDYVIDHAGKQLSESMIKELHRLLKEGTADSRKDWFAIGAYKKLPNEVGGHETASPEEVSERMQALLSAYSSKQEKNFRDLLDFHYQFESIHPFQDGNGRVGRLILFKECLKYKIVPFIIGEDLRMFYYRGLHEWKQEEGYLTDTCLLAQDRFKAVLDYFRIPYEAM